MGALRRRVGLAAVLLASAGCVSGNDLATDRATVLERTCRVMIERRVGDEIIDLDLPTADEFEAFLAGDAPRPHSVRALRALCRLGDLTDDEP